MSGAGNEVAVTLIGILDDGWAGLGDPARHCLAGADLIIGVARTLQQVRAHVDPAQELRAMDGALAQLPAWIIEARRAGRRTVVLATGDPLCHGLAASVIARLGREAVHVLPAPSTLQLAAARFGKSWPDAAIASCHGPDAGEWQPGATPAHGLYPVMQSLARHRRVLVLTSPANDPARLARALLRAGRGEGVRLSVACRLLRADEQLFPDLTTAEAAAINFPAPCVALVERQDAPEQPLFGLPDDAWQQRRPAAGLITRQEVRAVSLARLALRRGDVVWDIGAGSGALGLEAARLADDGHVWAIEKNAADAAIARANAEALGVLNYSLFEGRAPALLDGWPDPDAVFIGGSGGALAEIVHLAFRRLRPGGRLVMNFVTLENLAMATGTLGTLGLPWDVVQVQVSRSQPILGLTRLAAQNPVWVVSSQRPPGP